VSTFCVAARCSQGVSRSPRTVGSKASSARVMSWLSSTRADVLHARLDVREAEHGVDRGRDLPSSSSGFAYASTRDFVKPRPVDGNERCCPLESACVGADLPRRARGTDRCLRRT
jgi:hypothetical protein